MNITFNFKNFEPSEHLKEYAASHFEKLLKYVPDQDEQVEIQVNLAVEKIRHMADVLFIADGLHLSAYQESPDMYATIDLVLDKLEAQARKYREKIKELRRSGPQKTARLDLINFVADAADGKRRRNIISSDSFEPKPMDVDQAVDRLAELEYDFLVFRNSETDRINVIYRRSSGDFGLIDPGI